MSNDTSAIDKRSTLDGVDERFIQRWSPRAFTPGTIDAAVLARVFEAARWSPSCFNEQPWRFHTSTENTHAQFLSLLMEGNQVWAGNASIIGFISGRTQLARNNKDNDCYAFDCGAAWMAMCLQAQAEGLYTHGMAGIHYDQVSEYLGLDADQEKVLMGFVIGRIASADTLPEALQEREIPSGRKSLESIWTQHPA